VSRIRIAPLAGDDLEAVHDYFVRESDERKASEMTQQILDRVEQLARFPRLGVTRRGVAGDWRVFPEGSFLIYYREIQDGIELLRVIHGRRDQLAALATD
jgi:toxin ParE1/3/4